MKTTLTVKEVSKTLVVTGNKISLTSKAKALMTQLENLGYTVKLVVK